ncbi:hypothetical protein MIT9_P1792 [Methylomarinovum caldicuralii]|uniref:Thymidine phosphorylase n=1 Tax=Methylomarinovum caldicuralii TaxID=438856 RepID=A0AAU9CW65_9GAMM|nr:DUF1631 domain-containing protein [Methylomarinovum caldicuralii]BCX82207.1 hypothetical protein MIT9_P1792 [Methylomarinovum caldicuralii]
MNAKKVVEIHSAGRMSKAQAGPIIAECRSYFHKEYQPLLERFFARLDDELFALSDKAVSSTLQELYFEAMRYLRRNRENIQKSYLNALLRGYDEFWNAPQPAQARPAASLELDEDDFSLVEEENLEEELAVSTLANKGNTLYHRELFALNQRFAKLAGRAEIGNEDSPLGPQQLGQRFAEVLRPLTLELKVRLVIFKFYEQTVLPELEDIYDGLNELLAAKGVLPEISRKVKKKKAAAPAAAKAGEPAAGGVPAEDQAVYVQAVQAMHSLLAAWRSQVGLPSLSASVHPDATVSDSGEVVGALSALQDPEQVAKLTEALASGGDVNLKLVLAERLSELHGDKRALAQVDEDIIDMIGMIFDFILEDRNLPDTVKALIGRLQIPIVKVAILDKSFFSKKNHPARVLLNRLAHAGIGLSGDENLEANPVFRQISASVNRILEEFTQNVDLFQEILTDFERFMEEEGRRSQLLEERTRQATQSKEHLTLAKKEVAEEIRRRLQGRELPAYLRHFLTHTWKDILLVACLRRDKEPELWEAKLALTDTLLASLQPPADDGKRKRMLKRLPGLLRALRQELEAVSLDPKQIALFFRELEQAHRPLLDPAGDAAVDPRLAKELDAIATNLPEVDDIEVSELTDFDESDIEEEIVMLEEGVEEEEGDEFLAQARGLEVGDWIELKDPRGRTVRAKLSWVSKVTGVRIFVNRRGVKVAEYTLPGLAAVFRRGEAKRIDGKVPLMDRALAAMMATLQQHPAKQEGGDEPPASQASLAL